MVKNASRVKGLMQVMLHLLSGNYTQNKTNDSSLLRREKFRSRYNM